MRPTTWSARPTLEFIALLIALSIPFWVLGPVAQAGWGRDLPVNLSVSALMTVCPLLAPAAVLLGVVWAAWHVIPYIQAHHSPGWIVWQSVNSVALRALIVCIHRNTGRSVFAAIVFHGMINVGDFTFPNRGLYFDPLVVSVATWAVAGVVLLVPNPATLTRRTSTRTQ